MRKGIKTCLLVIVIICILCTNVKAADTSVFSITDVKGSKGEEVTIYINLDKELDFASADLVLEYDTSKLEYVKYTELNVLKESAMHIVKNNSDTGKIAIGYVSNPNTATSKKSPGQMLSLTFKIISDESNSIKLDLKCKSLKKDNGESIQVEDLQAVITVVGQSNNSINNPTNNSINNNNNSNSYNNNYNSNNSEINSNKNVNVVEVKENNPKASNTALPKTGSEIGIIGLLIVIFTIISMYFYKKSLYLRNI